MREIDTSSPLLGYRGRRTVAGQISAGVIREVFIIDGTSAVCKTTPECPAIIFFIEHDDGTMSLAGHRAVVLEKKK